ncbi:hypothetical protein [Pseudomonas reidholzensis]|uniref:hypothetical protein n=1 Tax=Pseudomonas reidholzensis TaxID=1785162 RepID=UPI0011C45A2B|nr:hypothetical protein [Pseudomonas reidholzensis]
MPVVDFLFNFRCFQAKPPKNLHKNSVGSGYLSIPVVALRRLAPLNGALLADRLRRVEPNADFRIYIRDWRGPPDCYGLAR